MLIEEDMDSMMQQIIGKLNLLNYEKDLCRVKGIKPIHDAYFIVS